MGHHLPEGGVLLWVGDVWEEDVCVCVVCGGRGRNCFTMAKCSVLFRNVCSYEQSDWLKSDDQNYLQGVGYHGNTVTMRLTSPVVPVIFGVESTKRQGMKSGGRKRSRRKRHNAPRSRKSSRERERDETVTRGINFDKSQPFQQ